MQARISNACQPDGWVRSVNQNGSALCQTIAAGTGLSLSSATGTTTLGVATPLTLTGTATFGHGVINVTHTGTTGALFGTSSGGGGAGVDGRATGDSDGSLHVYDGVAWREVAYVP